VAMLQFPPVTLQGFQRNRYLHPRKGPPSVTEGKALGEALVWDGSNPLAGDATIKCTPRRVRVFANSSQDTSGLESDFRTRGQHTLGKVPARTKDCVLRNPVALIINQVAHQVSTSTFVTDAVGSRRSGNGMSRTWAIVLRLGVSRTFISAKQDCPD
jgi:hypothetical protein